MTDAVESAGSNSGRERSYLASVGRAVRRRAANPPWLARSAGVGLAVVSLAFVAGFLAVLGTHGLTLFVTNPATMRVLLALPYIIVVLATGTVVGAALSWRHGYWSRAARIHQTVLAVLGVAFVWQLFELGVLP